MDPLSFLCVCVCVFFLVCSCHAARFSFVGGAPQSRVKLSPLFFFFLSVRCLGDEICPEYVWALCLTAVLSSECRPHAELSKQSQELKARQTEGQSGSVAVHTSVHTETNFEAAESGDFWKSSGRGRGGISQRPNPSCLRVHTKLSFCHLALLFEAAFCKRRLFL